MTADENFKFVFREAKINDAILFFDECEAIFETRDHGRYNINTLLTEFERQAIQQKTNAIRGYLLFFKA